MSSMFKVISRAFLAGLLVLAVQVGAGAAEKLPADVETKIQALISKAIAEGDASVLEDGLFELVEENAELAAAVADYASSNLPPNLPADIMGALVVASAAGPALAAPSKAGEILKVVESNQPKHTAALTSGLEEALAGIEGLGDFETAAGGPPTLPSFAAPTAVSATAENPSVVSASPSG